MSKTSVDICNDALNELGDQPITALTDNTVRARLCNQFYDKAVEYVLRAGNWNCATKRTTLARLQSAPAWGFTYAYALPNDWMRTISTHLDEDGLRWSQEDGKILTDEEAVKIKYVYRLVDPTKWDAQLTQAVIYFLAFKLAGSITEKEAKKTMLFQLYQQTVEAARGTSGQEGTPEEINSDVLITARF